ncbi:MAG: branched-chain amino acid aminotransferase/4-amino-4-deoxychorismate lyase [Maricaulis maris]|jgi:branched-chain amino acid aminotransferase/4-amino-4-deoxychorismate lyase
MTGIAFKDGDWLETGQTGWALADRGVLLGDGLFETLHVIKGKVVRLDRHMARLTRSAAELGLPGPRDGDSIAELVAELVARNALKDAIVRLTLTAGPGLRGLERPEELVPSLTLTAAPRLAPPASIRLALSEVRRSPASLAARHKTLSYMDNIQARRQARGHGADMALLLDTRGNVSGCDCANVFWLIGGEVYTPATACGVLAGTVRAEIVDSMPVETGAFGLDVLEGAEAVFVTNAAFGAVPVTELDGRPLGSGELPARIRALFA